MPEISEEALATLQAQAAAAPPPPVMVEISEDELADLRARAAAAGKPREAGDGGPVATWVAVLADGTRLEYTGAHPTHAAAAEDAAALPVVSVYQKP